MVTIAKDKPVDSPIEIGVMFRREQHPSTLTSYARRVEEMGFDQLWVVEDCFYQGGIAQAAIALTATERVKVGLGINPAVARNPAILAMEYATLANAFPGRFIGGIGHGVAEWMDQIGARPDSWLTSIEETTSSVLRILRGENVTTSGTYVHLSDVQLFDAPEQVPPVLLGVRGEKSLRLAGSCADGALLAENSPPAYIRWALERMQEGRSAANRHDAIELIVYANCLVDDDAPDSARREMRQMVAEMNGGGLSVSTKLAPYAPEMLALIERGGAKALQDEMPDAWIHELAIAGSHADARASVKNLTDAGANAVVLVPPDKVDYDAWLEKQGWATAESGTR